MEQDWEQRLTAEALAGLRSGSPPLTVTADADGLDAAFATCRSITAQHSRTFFFATALLPAHKRSAVRALYAFCRCTDDIIDDPREDAPDELSRWRADALAADPRTDHPVLLAWAHTRVQFGISNAYPRRLIDSVERDLRHTRYANFDELVDYCYGVASTVGLMSMQIVGFEGEEAVPYAIKLGVAMQLTNILRDVAEDYDMGRVYLPGDELTEYGLSEGDIAEGIVDERWRAFMRFQISRARELYRDAWQGIPMLSPDGQFSIAAAADLYAGILGQIERQGYDVFSRRACVSRAAKLARLPGIYLRLRSAQHSRRDTHASTRS